MRGTERAFHAKMRDFLGFPQRPQGCGKVRKKNPFEVLDIEQWCSKIANGSALPKSVEPCRGFTVGSEVDPRYRSYSEAPY